MPLHHEIRIIIDTDVAMHDIFIPESPQDTSLQSTMTALLSCIEGADTSTFPSIYGCFHRSDRFDKPGLRNALSGTIEERAIIAQEIIKYACVKIEEAAKTNSDLSPERIETIILATKEEILEKSPTIPAMLERRAAASAAGGEAEDMAAAPAAEGDDLFLAAAGAMAGAHAALAPPFFMPAAHRLDATDIQQALQDREVAIGCLPGCAVS